MTRLQYRNGAVVEVTEEKVERLRRMGFSPADDTKAPAKKAASRKPAAKADE